MEITYNKEDEIQNEFYDSKNDFDDSKKKLLLYLLKKYLKIIFNT